MSHRTPKPPDAQTAAALHQLARCFWSAAVAVVEKRMDQEDVQRPVQRIKLVRPYVAPVRPEHRDNAVSGGDSA